MIKFALLLFISLTALAQESVDMVTEPDQQIDQGQWQAQDIPGEQTMSADEEVREPASEIPVDEPIYE